MSFSIGKSGSWIGCWRFALQCDVREIVLQVLAGGRPRENTLSPRQFSRAASISPEQRAKWPDQELSVQQRGTLAQDPTPTGIDEIAAQAVRADELIGQQNLRVGIPDPALEPGAGARRRTVEQLALLTTKAQFALIRIAESVERG